MAGGSRPSGHGLTEEFAQTIRTPRVQLYMARARPLAPPPHTRSHPLDRLLMLRPMHRLRGGAALRVAGRRRADHRLHAVRRHASISKGSDPQACKIPRRSIQSSVQTNPPTSLPALFRTPLYFSGLEPTKPRFSTPPPNSGNPTLTAFRVHLVNICVAEHGSRTRPRAPC